MFTGFLFFKGIRGTVVNLKRNPTNGGSLEINSTVSLVITLFCKNCPVLYQSIINLYM